MTHVVQFRKRWMLLLAGSLWPMIFLTQEVQGTISTPPRFEDYATPEWTGQVVPVKLSSTEERMFRTSLRAAAKEPANFAGHCRVAIWGCGTRCSAGAIIDLENGKVFPLPLAGKAAGEEHWIFCADSPAEHTIEYRRNSRLMILRCGASQIDLEGISAPDLYYFVWEHELFREILHFTPTALAVRPKSR